MENIRNFSIIAHIDHGKSTLADRMLELTETVEKRNMQEQVLDTMELERERGITIKMQPVRMLYKTSGETEQEYVLNLIDTPGHIDFAYEVSRALKAVEGAVLLVDATQGVQAQTFSTLQAALEQGVMLIPAVSKIDSPRARVDEVKLEVAELLSVNPDEVFEVSGRTGDGVPALLDAVVERVAPPSETTHDTTRALVFDFEYSDHRGIILYVRLFDGSVSKGDKVRLHGAGEAFTALEVGIFSPHQTPTQTLTAGSIGYVVTGIKKPGVASVGDTLMRQKDTGDPLAGYLQPKPVVWASIYPESQDDFSELKKALERLRLTDASLSFDEEMSGALGRGFRCGFLGMLHLEIISERLKREFDLPLIITTPSVEFRVDTKNGETVHVYTPVQFPDHGDIEIVYEPWVEARIIAPAKYLGALTQLLFEHEAIIGDSVNVGDRTSLSLSLPLRELYRNLFDELKGATSGYASLSYDVGQMKPADVTRMDVLVGGEPVPAFARVVATRRVQEEAEAVTGRLKELLPRQQVAMKIQAVALGRILSSETLKAFRKDVTAGLYGGDITRKRKVLERQKRGKKKLKESARANIPHDTFIKMMRPKG